MKTNSHAAVVALILSIFTAFVACELIAEEIDVPHEMKWQNPTLKQLLQRLSANANATSEADKGRIVGGVPATPFEFPWLTSLRYKGSSSRYSRHFCGGSLINKRFVFTAAHCSVGMSTSRVEVGLRNHNLYSNTEGETRSVSKINVHPRYDSNSMSYDFAIWQLSSDSTVTPVQVISATSTISSPGQLATIAGWGTTSYEGSLSSVLLKTQVPIVSNTDCATKLNTPITDSMICAGLVEGGKDTCQGDSGGPLFFPTETGPILAGDTSFGYGCASPDMPGVYGRLTAALPYIDAIVNNKAFVTIQSLSLSYSSSSQRIKFSVRSIILKDGRSLSSVSITVVLTKTIGSTTTTETINGRTDDSGSFTFSRSATQAGTYTTCITALTRTNYQTDLSENCRSIHLV
eukprot:TRINITY_DN178_c0_g1_i8.p1 TRINITY_DN178_c0_g1~~TRINITY_DN178_c0_g1_i8.p1  ORF type:complete len:404 (-),score=65.59 TRINITY_DN178_c0_g1_i8:124-1335(-)